MEKEDFVQNASNSEGVEVDDIQVGNEDEEMNQQTHTNPLSRNPMEVDLIIEKLFGLCSSKTLANCRLVCKQWKNVCFKDWRNKAVLCASKKLEGGDSLIEYLRLQVKDESLQLQKYPFRNFRIDSHFPEYSAEETKNPITSILHCGILQDIRGEYKDLDMFLSKFNNLQVLELKNCTWKRIFDEEVPLSDSLKHLIIYRNDDSRFPTIGNSEFIEGFPNLQTLSVELECSTYDSFRGNLATCSELATSISPRRERNDPMNLNLKDLEIIVKPLFPTKTDHLEWNLLNMNCLNPIAELNLNLERLVLDLTWHHTIEMKKVIRLFLRVLESFSESLQYLRTSFRFNVEHYMDFVFDECQKDRPIRLISALTPIRGMTIPMETLKEVKLANGIWAFFLLAHLELPNLEKLIIEYGKSTKKAYLELYQMRHLTGKVFPRLESFELLENNEIPGPEMMATFVTMMPNLVHLNIPLDKQTFRIVCESFGGLRILNVQAADCQYAVLDDGTLTGLGVTQDAGIQRNPNITDLTCLTDLTISSDCAFTDHAVIHGFLQLPGLHHLKVAFTEISDGIKAKLMEQVAGCVLQIVEKDDENDYDYDI